MLAPENDIEKLVILFPNKICWKSLSHNETITTKIVEKNLDKPWNWYALSKNETITSEFVEQNIDKPWCWGGLSQNLNITWKFVEKNLDKQWDWKSLSQSETIIWKIIEKNLDKPWDWSYLSGNTFNYKQRLKRYKEDKAARIIQKGCHNWLWSPKCKDGTIGISVKIAWKNIQTILKNSN